MEQNWHCLILQQDNYPAYSKKVKNSTMNSQTKEVFKNKLPG